MTQAYPLAWPDGWPRTKSPTKSQFKVTLSAAVNDVTKEVRLLGGVNPVISSNVSLGNQRPTDTGIAVYFVRSGRQLCVPCDRWNKPEDNLRAIAKTIEALRGIERWGAKHMVDAAFSGFVALPPPDPTKQIGKRPWHDVLGVTQTAKREEIETAFRDLARRNHPDIVGPSGHDIMAELNRAKSEALQARQSG